MEQHVALYDQVLARIRGFAAARGWKPARLAKEAGLSDMVTRGMERADWAPSGASVRKIEALIPAAWRPDNPLPPDDPDLPAAPAASGAEGAASTAGEPT